MSGLWAYSCGAGFVLMFLLLFSILTVAKRSDERAEREWQQYLDGRK